MSLFCHCNTFDKCLVHSTPFLFSVLFAFYPYNITATTPAIPATPAPTPKRTAALGVVEATALAALEVAEDTTFAGVEVAEDTMLAGAEVAAATDDEAAAITATLPEEPAAGATIIPD